MHSGHTLSLLLLVAVASGAQESKQPDLESMPVDYEDARLYQPGVAAGTPDGFVALKPGPHLFLDDYLIKETHNLRRVVNVPRRDPSIPNPVVTGKEDGCFQPYLTVLRDPDTKRFRIWFGHRTEDSNGSRSRLGYMESEDGIHWIRPARVLDDPAPIQFGVSILDDGPRAASPQVRYKYGWHMDGGLKVAASPDGLVWTPLAPEPVLKHNHDINGIYYDPVRQRYVATVSVYRPSDAWSGRRRVTMQAFSRDLLKWENPHFVLLPDAKADPGETQFYAMDGYLARGDLIVGMVKVLHDDWKADNPPNPPDAYGVGYTTLAWTHDGDTWFRDTERFFDPDPKPDAWDHAHAWIDEQVPVGDEVYLYYGGYAHGHKVNRFEERQIGLLKMPRDRYVARVAGAQDGRLLTPLLRIQAQTLSLNADAPKGEIRVEIIDDSGKPIPGFAREDCSPVAGNGVTLPVTWKQPLSALPDKPVYLSITLRDAALYAVNLE